MKRPVKGECDAQHLVAGLLLAALMVACETKTPVGPQLSPTTSTTTSSTMTTAPTTSTSSSTTTTIPVLTSLVRSFKAFPPPPPNIPAEMTLFYQLIVSAPPAPVGAARLRANADPVPGENKYGITGVYVMGNATTGTVTGELGGAVNPLETGGTFTGTLTARTPSGCTADRPYTGPLGNQGFTFAATGPGTATCSPSPMAPANSVNMLLSDPGAPLPTPPPTSSSSSTTTTSIQCTYSLSPPSPLQVGSAGGTQSVTITTQAGCGWSAQSFDSWITMNPPFGGTGTTTITFNVSSATVGRTGRLLLAGHDYVVNQAAPLSDLIFVPSTMTCTEPRGRPGERIVRVEVFNRGPGPASASITRVVFSNLDPFGLPDPAFVVRVQTPEVAANRSSSHTLPVPSTCFFGDPPTQRCFMEARADYDAQVVESSEDNNRTGGECTRPAPPPPPIPITGIRRK